MFDTTFRFRQLISLGAAHQVEWSFVRAEVVAHIVVDVHHFRNPLTCATELLTHVEVIIIIHWNPSIADTNGPTILAFIARCP